MCRAQQAGAASRMKTAIDTNTVTRRHAIAPSPRGAMLRSLFIPGWGQWYNGKRLKALVFFCGEWGLLANSIYLNQKYQASTTDYEREFYIENRNLSTWWLVGSVLYAMLDAYVDAHLATFDESPDLSLRYYPGNNLRIESVSLCLRIQLD